MNIRIKTTIIIVITLLIGVLLGILIDRTITRSQFQHRIAKMRNPEGLIFMLERIIEPDESQRETIRKMLIKHNERLSEIDTQHRKKFAALMDSLRLESDSVLTDEQKARLKDRIERVRSWRKKGPPFGRPNRRPMELPPPPPPIEEENHH